MLLLVVALSSVANVMAVTVGLEAKASSAAPQPTSCIGHRLGRGLDVIQIGPNTRLLEITVAADVPAGFTPNFTMKPSGNNYVFSAEACQSQDCQEYCLYAQGCGSRVSMYPCPYNFFGNRQSISLWQVSESRSDNDTPLYRITNVGCPSMKLQLWEPDTDVMECLFEEGGCKWGIVQQKACQLPFPADVGGTSCNSDPARSLVTSDVYPNLTEVDYDNPSRCATVMGLNPLDLWKLDGWSGNFISFAPGLHHGPTMLLKAAALSISLLGSVL